MKTLFLRVGLVSILVAGLLFAFSPSNRKVSNIDKASTTVKIVRLDERSGGTGSIISSGSMSKVLTNSHVCEVAKNGGLVITDNGNRFLVFSYQQSERHDLCLITVNADLGTDTTVSSTPPSLYDDAVISGHPSLLPTIITKGHFSSKVMGEVMTGMRKCTEEEMNGPGALVCMFMGGVPVIRIYEMQVVSATIKPGSSGSAVYNSKGEISGVVFAGSGDLGYAMVVPHEYVLSFLNDEVSKLPIKFPSLERSPNLAEAQSHTNESCKTVKDPTLQKICNILSKSTLYVSPVTND